MATSKKDYLKRYQSVEEKEKKPKKSKKRKAAATKALGGVVIVDSDAGWQKNIDEDDEDDAEIEEGADGPQVIEDVEVKRMHQMERLKQHRPYMSIGDDGSGWVNVTANTQDSSPPRRRRNDSPEEENDERRMDEQRSQSPDLSPQRRVSSAKVSSHVGVHDMSPPRKRQSQIDVEDMSPPRKKENGMDGRKKLTSSIDDISPPRRRQSGIDPDDMSPPRKRESGMDGRKDAHGMRKNVASSIDDISPPRRRQSRIDYKDLSPQRRISSARVGSDVGKQDMSPPRRRQSRIDEEDMSPPRKRVREVDGRKDANGMRKKLMVPSSIDDISPPSRRQSRIDVQDVSPPRKRESMVDYKKSGNGVGKHDDMSPPRRRPSRMASEDISPPRRRENSKDFSKSTTGGTGKKRLDSPDISPLRRRQRMDSPDESALRRDMPPPQEIGTNPIGARKKTKMTDGRQAGLTSDVDLAAELARRKRDEAKRMKEMEPSVSGRGAETIYRDKRGKRLEGLEELLRQQQGEAKPEVKPLEWGKGLAQKREVEQQKAEYDAEKSKPFARSRDDPELDKLMKGRLRWGDPMAHLVKTKDPEAMLVDLGATDEMKESGFIIPQDVPKHSWLKRGIGAPMNRYGIKPGRHWDGVDRSTGFEAQMFKAKAEKQANELEAYMWSVADM